MTSYACQGCALVVALAVLPGCGWFGKKDAAKDVKGSGSEQTLCSIDNKPVIKESDFNNSLNQMLQANPYFRGAGADSLPMQIKRRFFDELVKQELIIAEADKTNIEKDPEFQKSLEEMVKLVKRSLKVQFFEKKVFEGIKVSDSDSKKYFEENKERYMKAAGGVLVAGASFANDADAQAFMHSTKTSVDEFEKLAKANKKATFKDFGRVSKGAQGMGFGMTPAPVKEAALAMHKLPGVEKVKVGKEIWVIKAWDKKDSVYYEYSEIKPQLEMVIKNNQARDVLEKLLKDLREKFKVVVNEDFFKDATKPAEGDVKVEAKAAQPAATTAVA
jgi:peptidylprolyl isomerase